MFPTRNIAVLAGVFSLALLCAPQAEAAWVQLDHVGGDVTSTGSRYDYAFTVYNDSEDSNPSEDPYGGVPVIVDWELPYFSDMGISDILSPSGWAYEIATIGVANAASGWSGVADWMTDPAWSSTPFASVTQVIHWYCSEGVEGQSIEQPSGNACWNAIWPSQIRESSSLSGFGLTADYAPTDAPYQSSWDYTVPRRVGDPPMPIAPASPCAMGNCRQNDVPEPGSLALLGLGVVALVAARRRRVATV